MRRHRAVRVSAARTIRESSTGPSKLVPPAPRWVTGAGVTCGIHWEFLPCHRVRRRCSRFRCLEPRSTYAITVRSRPRTVDAPVRLHRLPGHRPCRAGRGCAVDSVRVGARLTPRWLRRGARRRSICESDARRAAGLDPDGHPDTGRLATQRSTEPRRLRVHRRRLVKIVFTRACGRPSARPRPARACRSTPALRWPARLVTRSAPGRCTPARPRSA